MPLVPLEMENTPKTTIQHLALIFSLWISLAKNIKPIHPSDLKRAQEFEVGFKRRQELERAII